MRSKRTGGLGELRDDGLAARDGLCDVAAPCEADKDQARHAECAETGDQRSLECHYRESQEDADRAGATAFAYITHAEFSAAKVCADLPSRP